MALDSTPPYWPRLYDDDGDDVKDYDVISMVTSTAMMMSERGGNTTRKWKCSVGEDVSQRITVVSAIMICTIVGNLALILTLTCKGTRRIKRVNVFLVNLAIGDLAVALFTNTTEILFLAFGDWALGPAACKISVYMQIVTLASATFLLTAMSMDRYQVIVKPLQSLAQRPRIWMKVTIAWVMAFVFATPQLFIFLQITEEQDGVRRRCCVSKGYTEEWQRKVYLSFLTSYILLLPTALMIYCYAKIIHVVWIRARAEDSNSQHAHGIISKEEYAGSPRMSVRRGLVTASKRRAITMTLTVVVGFLLCQTPYFIVSLIRVYSDYHIKLPALLAVSENIVLMHSTLNPVLYGLFTMRSYHLTSLLRCFLCRGSPVSRGERRLLLQGQRFGASFKSPSHQHAAGQIHREPEDDMLCKRNGSCKEEPFGKDGTPRTESSNNEKVMVRKRDKCRKQDNTNMPLLLITNTAAIEHFEEKKSPTDDGATQKEDGGHSGPKKERKSSVRWGEDTHCVIRRGSFENDGKGGSFGNDGKMGSFGNDRSSLSCSQWTPSHVDTKSECYSCV